MDSRLIKALGRELGLDCIGIAAAELPAEVPTEPICPLAAGHGEDRWQPKRLLPACRAIIVVLFPYYHGQKAGKANLSLYCQSRDYHQIIRDYLTRFDAAIRRRFPDSRQVAVIDTTPLADRYLAQRAGLGFFGDNRCLIHETYGTYCFIGSLLTTLPLDADAPNQRECRHCGACAAACPGNCFTGTSYTYERCKSYLTQKKGDLSPAEIAIIQKTPLVFGCDECQRVCPHNRDVPVTPLPEFREQLLTHIDAAALESITNGQFRAAYGNRAFAWRGKKILLRNLAYLKENGETPPPFPAGPSG